MALRPRTSLKLLIDVLTLMAMVVDVIAAIWSNCVLSVVTPAAMAWTFPFVGKMKATTERTIEMAFPIRAMMNTPMTMPEAREMRDFACFPMLGTFCRAGMVMLVAATRVESETLLVRFEMSVFDDR